MGKLKKGYNWKARQSSQKLTDSAKAIDTNQIIVLPNNEKKVKNAPITMTRNKLNPKQKKRLKKVLEAKEQKAMVTLYSNSLQEYFII